MTPLLKACPFPHEDYMKNGIEVVASGNDDGSADIKVRCSYHTEFMWMEVWNARVK